MILTRSLLLFPFFLFTVVIGSPFWENNEEQRVHLGDTPKETYPSLVSLGFDQGGGVVGKMCGATLITDQHLLTAAHCYDETYKTWRIILGSRHAYLPEGNGSQVMEFGLDAWTVNPKYNRSDTSTNDNAVITLPQKVKLSDVIKTTRLAKKSYTENVRVVGWGKNDCNGGTPTYYLYAKGTIVDDKTCKQYYPVKKTQICAQFTNEAGEPSGSDGGDSGGPLFATADDGSDVQIGVVTFSAKQNANTPQECTDPSKPMVYSRVAESGIRKFIKSVAKKAKFV